MSASWRWAALGALGLLAACAPRMYQRSTVVLDHAESERFDLRYGELDGCLFKHQLPVEYRLQRKQYRLQLRPLSALQGAAPRIELLVEAQPPLDLGFPGMAEPPAPQYAERGTRYVVDTAQLADGVLQLQLRSGGQVVGEERFELSTQSCRVFSPTG